MDQSNSPQAVDAVIVGAGFSGLYLLHRLRGLGFTTRVFERGTDVGGTWYWNRYPGARCDVESMQYSYSFSDELQQEWQWSERFSAQPEILQYAKHVAERFDLRKDITFETSVEAAHFDELTQRWSVHTDGGETLSARFCIMATGCISTAQTPAIDGLEDYQGSTYHTGSWPHEGVDFSGQRIAVVGTGSSGIQAIPVLAEQAAHVTVFQRTPNYSLPSQNGPMTPEYEASWKANYDALREEQRQTAKGTIRDANNEPALSVSDDERRRMFEERWAIGGAGFLSSYNDLLIDNDANGTAAEFVREKIRSIVKDPATAELLAPKTYPIGTKRICIDSGYFQTYNRDNVELVDISQQPIEKITPTGLVANGTTFEFDSIVFATGFDAMTGTLFRVDIAGREGRKLQDKWEAGPRTYLGVMSEGFPNLFMITGPGSPSVLSNMMVSIEQHVDWVTESIVNMRDNDLDLMEPELKAEDDWVEHVNHVAHQTLFPQANSWYMGANIPGKPRLFMPYIGGVGAYRKICNEVVSDGYRGFRFAGSQMSADAAD
ncbi:MAG: NAD(P)/FAD-dependent oxidoreductase [Gammaproteobacteria bacterium]|nr:NAD(P)/FAD-dependent oxidoreductase [Gammaproteobacteria bacterium]